MHKDLVPKILFHNHASFSIFDNNCHLICDPYITGTAFDNGWKLIADDVKYDLEFDKLNFIYISHEHPDHFSISFLKSIPEDLRKDITILYQYTPDKKVVKFCQKLNYKTIEIPDKSEIEIESNIKIRIGKVPFYDSWAIINWNSKIIINANDCVLENPEKIFDIKKYVDNCDLLFTQFSYANWIEGGIQDNKKRKEAAEEKLYRIKTQSEILKPSFIAPYASMVYFCNLENFYMNDSINTPHKTIQFIERETSSSCIMFRPNQIWQLGDQFNNDISIEFWKNKYEKALLNPELIKIKSVEMEDILESERKMKSRVWEKKQKLIVSILSMIKFFPDLNIYIKDLNKSLIFSWTKALQVNTLRNKDSIEINSSALNFIFSFNYGIDTVFINARFNANLKNTKKMIRSFSVLSLNNTGRHLTILGVFKFLNLSLIKRVLRFFKK